MAADRNEIVEWMDSLRAAIFDAVTESDVRDIVRGLVAKAKEGDRAAVQTLFTYCIGPNTLLPKAPSAADEPAKAERDRIDRAVLRMRESKRAAGQ